MESIFELPRVIGRMFQLPRGREEFSTPRDVADLNAIVYGSYVNPLTSGEIARETYVGLVEGGELR